MLQDVENREYSQANYQSWLRMQGWMNEDDDYDEEMEDSESEAADALVALRAIVSRSSAPRFLGHILSGDSAPVALRSYDSFDVN